MKLLGGDHGEAFGQVKTHLVSEYRNRASTSPIRLFNALGEDFFHQIVILAHKLGSKMVNEYLVSLELTSKNDI